MTLTVTQQQQAVIAEARAQIGKPYLWDGKGPDSFDCSGLTAFAYMKGLGLNIGAGTVGQLANPDKLFVFPPGAYTWAQVVAKLLAADLIFVSSGEHVLLYSGGTSTIEAPSSGHNVREDSPTWAGTSGNPIFAVCRYLGYEVKPVAPVWPGQYLKLQTPEMTGAGVLTWQKQIKVTADGVFGTVTASGTKLFQEQHKLTVDGIVGPVTWAAAWA